MEWLMMVMALASAPTLPAERDINVAADLGWKHAATGLLLMPQLAGLPRTALTDATLDELDVTAQFDAPDRSLSATIYVFHPAIADAGLWFDSAKSGLQASRTFRNATPATVAPVAFAAGTVPAASSLRQVYSTLGGRYRSTALAVVPVGDWIVSIQMSAKALTADQLNARLQQVMSAIRWPSPTGAAARMAVAVPPCPMPLASATATLAEPDSVAMGNSSGGNTRMAGTAAAGPVAGPAWCREGAARTAYGVYRSAGSATAYVMTLNDTGGIVSVYRPTTGADARTGTYAVSLQEVNGAVSIFPSYTALPTPEQVWAAIENGKRAGPQ